MNAKTSADDMDSAPAKREFATALLQESSVFIHLDPRREGTIVPGWLKRQPQLVLQIGLNMAVRIPDLDVGEEAICCTLSFNRSPFFCRVPWSAVFGLVGEDGRGRIWPEDVPLEVASQMQQQMAKEPQKPGDKPQRQQRARLQAVRSSPAPEAPEAAVAAPVPSAAAAEPAVVQPQEPAAPAPAAERKPAASSPPGKKRELPAYLRVVK